MGKTGRRGASPRQTITASEIGEYAYCARAWWYKHVVKLPPDAGGTDRLLAGTRAHRRHGRWVSAGSRLSTLAALLALCGLLALLLALFLLRPGA